MINATITAISLGKAKSADHSSNGYIAHTENTTSLLQGRLICRLNSQIQNTCFV